MNFDKPQQLSFKLSDLIDWHIVGESVGCGPDEQHLFLDIHRLILRLFQNLSQSLAARQFCQSWLYPDRSELGKRRERSKLGQRKTETTGHCFIALICAAPPTRETELPTSIAGRMPELNRSPWRNICPSVIEITLVGM